MAAASAAAPPFVSVGAPAAAAASSRGTAFIFIGSDVPGDESCFCSSCAWGRGVMQAAHCRDGVVDILGACLFSGLWFFCFVGGRLAVVLDGAQSAFFGPVRKNLYHYTQSISFLYIPPLYLPKNCLQFGHLWVTEFKASMQQGTQAHGHNLRNTNIKHYERN